MRFVWNRLTFIENFYISKQVLTRNNNYSTHTIYLPTSRNTCPIFVYWFHFFRLILVQQYNYSLNPQSKLVFQICARERETFQMRVVRLHVLRKVGHETSHLGHPRKVQTLQLRILQFQNVVQRITRPSSGKCFWRIKVPNCCDNFQRFTIRCPR